MLRGCARRCGQAPGQPVCGVTCSCVVQVPDTGVNENLPPALLFPPLCHSQRLRGLGTPPSTWGRVYLHVRGTVSHFLGIREIGAISEKVLNSNQTRLEANQAAVSHSCAHKPGHVGASKQMAEPVLCHPGPLHCLAEAPRLSPGLDKEANSSLSLASLSPGSGQMMGFFSFPQCLSSSPRKQLPVQKQVNPDYARRGVPVLPGGVRGGAGLGLSG